LFCDIDNLIIVVPSKWLKEQVEKSFLKGYPVKVVPNGIDFSVFRPVCDLDLRKKYKIPAGEKILLGVARFWSRRKGLRDFVELASIIPNDYVVVLVGLSLKQQKNLPANVVGIGRTEDKKELASLYSEAYIFINPSVEETFSMVTVEAMACGTPVIVLDTSAVSELVDNNSGVVIHKGSKMYVSGEEYLNAIKEIERKISNNSLSSNSVRNKALKFSIKNQTDKIMDIYRLV
jgi:glycosyltransferase involved in cell wall biosynthesis